jgi:hypothetical protein
VGKAAMKLRQRLDYLVPLCIVLVYGAFLFLLVERLPFYWEDPRWIKHAPPVGASLLSILNPLLGQGDPLFERPVESLVLRIMSQTLGDKPIFFYAFKILSFLALALVIYFLILKSTRSIFASTTGMILTLFFSGNTESAIWICDFLIPSMLLSVIAGAMLYLVVVRHDDNPYLAASVVVLTIVGYQTKASALIIPVAFLVYVMLEPKGLRPGRATFIVMLTAMLAYVAVRHMHADARPSLLRPLSQNWYWLFRSVCVTCSVFVMMHLLALIVVYRKRGRPDRLVRYLLSILCVSLAFITFLPSFERRYLGILLVPVAILYPILLSRLSEQKVIGAAWHQRIAALVVALFIATNTYIALKNRLNLGMHIAKDNAVEWIETNYRGKNVYYAYWREFFNVEHAKNEYVLLSYSRIGRAEFLEAAAALCIQRRVDLFCVTCPLPNRRALAVCEGVNGSVFDHLMEAMKRMGGGMPRLYVYESLEPGDCGYIFDTQAPMSPYYRGAAR